MIWNQTQDVLFATTPGKRIPKTLVTVCVSAYNYEAFLPEALDSIREQTHLALELIVVDDASDQDDTCEVALEWLKSNAQRFWRVMLLCNRRNQGPSLTRNAAFERAKGKYVFVLDADNTVFPSAIAELYRVAVEGRFEATYSQLEMFGLERKLGHADLFDVERLRAGNYIDVMALIEVAAWRAIGGFSHIELGWEDYDFWLKFVEGGFTAGYVPAILCRYRLHGSSRTDRDAFPSHEALREIMALRHPVVRAA